MIAIKRQRLRSSLTIRGQDKLDLSPESYLSPAFIPAESPDLLAVKLTSEHPTYRFSTFYNCIPTFRKPAPFKILDKA